MSSASDEDIYRGEDEYHVLDIPAPSISSRSSSSASSVAAGRIGAIAAKLELAISRWARHVRGTSSSSSSSASSISSTNFSLSSRPTLSQSISRKHRRSRASSINSDREIALRITRLKALRQSRQVLRAFVLYLPTQAGLIREKAPGEDQVTFRQPRDTQHGFQTTSTTFQGSTIPNISSTTSLSVLLTQLDAVIRTFGKLRRQRHRHKESKLLDGTSGLSSRHRVSTLDDPILKSNFLTMRSRKGKLQEHMAKPLRISEEHRIKPQAWFLNVSSPTWSDLQAIGKLLHIHPLTLEDILQQDPRVKVEDFPKLGYYFISFRTIDTTGAKVQREAGHFDPSLNNQGFDEGSIGETNVYLTIFNDGICCFHFNDISEHTNRIRDMILNSDNNANMTSDWIAHTILDSIVDSCFPIVEEIDQEVGAIDQIVFSDPNRPLQDPETTTKARLPVSNTDLQLKRAEKTLTLDSTTSEKKTPSDKTTSYRTRFASPRLSIRLMFRRGRRFFANRWQAGPIKVDAPSATQSTLRRIARVKKLIVVLGRLLNSQSDIMTGVKKRLTKAMDTGPDEKAHTLTTEDVEIVMYMTDIQDHIFALQLSLAHNERMLSHSYPAYISNLRAELEMTKSGIDIKVMILSAATATALCIQTVTGAFSMNCTVPHNERDPNGRYVGFSLVLLAGAAIIGSMITLVRFWWRRAERKRSTSL